MTFAIVTKLIMDYYSSRFTFLCNHFTLYTCHKVTIGFVTTHITKDVVENWYTLSHKYVSVRKTNFNESNYQFNLYNYIFVH